MATGASDTAAATGGLTAATTTKSSGSQASQASSTGSDSGTAAVAGSGAERLGQTLGFVVLAVFFGGAAMLL